MRLLGIVALLRHAAQAPLQFPSSYSPAVSDSLSITTSPSFVSQPVSTQTTNLGWDLPDTLDGSCDPNTLQAYAVVHEGASLDDWENLDPDTISANEQATTTALQWWHPFTLASSLLSFFTQPRSYRDSFTSSDIEDEDGLHILPTRIQTDADPASWSANERILREIPQYVLDHAPLVHLFSGEQFGPCSTSEHLEHVQPYVNWRPLDSDRERYNVTNLNELNKHRRGLFLTSDDNVEDRPDWLGGQTNIPEEPKKHKGEDPVGGRSDAPVTMIAVDKGNGVVDAFYHFFYCYNLGNKVLNVRWGNHVGDWEHSVVRFKHGEPKEVFLSEHIFGQAFTYDAVEKIGKRPVIYSATGTHAMYATPAVHRYVLPFGLLHDETDRGPLWDPLLNMEAYTFNLTERRLRASTLTPNVPIEWFYFLGKWGDKAYPMNDRRQYYFAGQYHYVSGPTGPIFKRPGRRAICMNGKPENCKVKKSLEDADRIRRWPDGEELSEAEERQIWEEYGDEMLDTN